MSDAVNDLPPIRRLFAALLTISVLIGAAPMSGERLAADVLARHGKELAELTTSELRSEWAHWKGAAAETEVNGGS